MRDRLARAGAPLVYGALFAVGMIAPLTGVVGSSVISLTAWTNHKTVSRRYLGHDVNAR